jgi:hypothetical protein
MLFIATGARFLNPGTGWFYSPPRRGSLRGDGGSARGKVRALFNTEEALPPGGLL